MKKIIAIFILIYIVALSFNRAEAQSISSYLINSLGADYLSSDAIMNVSVGEVAIQTYSTSDAIINEGFQQPNLWDYFQNITIPFGWSGISTYIIPNNEMLDSIFLSFPTDSLIISDFDSLYIKDAQNNQLNVWANNEGKRVKVNSEFTVKYYGSRLENTNVQLNEGWNILPVLSTCAVSCDSVQSWLNNNSVIIIEIGSDKVFWPEKNINTLQLLEPGKAYYLKNNASSIIQFPVCY